MQSTDTRVLRLVDLHMAQLRRGSSDRTAKRLWSNKLCAL